MFHIRINGRARAFHKKPRGIIGRLVMLFRGWRPANEIWWSKPSKRQAEYEKNVVE